MFTSLLRFMGLNPGLSGGNGIPFWYGVPKKVRARAGFFALLAGLTVGLLVGFTLGVVWVGVFVGSMTCLLGECVFERGQFQFDDKYASKEEVK